VDAKGGVAVRPAGKRSIKVERWGEGLDEVVEFRFGSQCLDCPNYGLCTKSKEGRSLKVQVALSSIIYEYRRKEKGVKYQKKLKLRCPVEVTVSEVKRHGAGKARYRGLKQGGSPAAPHSHRHKHKERGGSRTETQRDNKKSIPSPPPNTNHSPNLNHPSYKTENFFNSITLLEETRQNQKAAKPKKQRQKISFRSTKKGKKYRAEEK